MDYAVHVAKVVTFFVINMFAYELIVFGLWALVIIPFCRATCKLPEELVDRIIAHGIRICMAIVIVLLALWVLDIYRLIPMPS